MIYFSPSLLVLVGRPYICQTFWIFCQGSARSFILLRFVALTHVSWVPLGYITLLGEFHILHYVHGRLVETWTYVCIIPLGVIFRVTMSHSGQCARRGRKLHGGIAANSVLHVAQRNVFLMLNLDIWLFCDSPPKIQFPRLFSKLYVVSLPSRLFF